MPIHRCSILIKQVEEEDVMSKAVKYVEGILDFFKESTLVDLNSKYSENYLWGDVPLLKYCKEAIGEFAQTVYNYKNYFLALKFEDVDSIDIDCDDYVKTYIEPYVRIESWITDNEERIKQVLEEVLPRFEPAVDYTMEKIDKNVAEIFDDSEQKLYGVIADFLLKNEDLSALLSNKFFGLRRYRGVDNRVDAIIQEFDKEREECNKVLDALVKSTVKKYTTQLKDAIRFLKIIENEDFKLVKNNLSNLSEQDSAIISNAISKSSFSTKDKKVYNQQLKHIKYAKSIINENRSELKKIQSTNYLLSKEEYNEVNELLHKQDDWALRTEVLIAKYKENTQNCISSVQYIEICEEVGINQVKLEFLKDYRNTEVYDTLSCELEYFAVSIDTKTKECGEEVIKNYNKLRVLSVEINELFIELILDKVVELYKNLSVEDVFFLGELINKSFQRQVTNEMEIENTRKMRALFSEKNLSENWFDDYVDIEDSLRNSLLVVFNRLSYSDLFTKEELEHGAIIGMLEWAEQLGAEVSKFAEMNKQIIVDYEKLAVDLRDKMQYNTLYHNDVDLIVARWGDNKLDVIKGMSREYIIKRQKTLEEGAEYGLYFFSMITGEYVKVCGPNILPPTQCVDKEHLINLVKNKEVEVNYTVQTFKITEKIKDSVNQFESDGAFIDYVRITLTEEEVAALVEVKDQTIKTLTFKFCASSQTFMLDGDLLVCIDKKNNKFLKIVPKIDTSGYATYRFTLVNRELLDEAILNLKRLLEREDELPTYLSEEVEQRFNYKGSRDEIEVKEAQYNYDVELHKSLRAAANEAFAGTNQTGLVGKWANVKYFKNYYISQHQLVAWIICLKIT